MVSGKFARNKHAFRVPDVCKKKIPWAEEGAYPPPVVYFSYDIDVTWLWFRHTFSGSNELNIEESPFGFSWRWMDTPVAPADGQWCQFQHTWISGGWLASLQYFKGGLLTLSGAANGIIDLKPPVIDTGTFELDFGPLWSGKRDARVQS
ncbi:hypothetical protein LCGC14_1469950 [marine sediment metagenome]|uniref:Uncharacterized protein n=1 Tax=marine sediment metagenome TaxID=412755 RepID=A0A0F9JD94_9ZZZZ